MTVGVLGKKSERRLWVVAKIWMRGSARWPDTLKEDTMDRSLQLNRTSWDERAFTVDLHIPFTAGSIGGFDTQLTYEFFQGFVNHAGVTLHIDNLKGVNAHHQCETVFKAFARALRGALERDPRMAGVIPSTKGSL